MIKQIASAIPGIAEISGTFRSGAASLAVLIMVIVIMIFNIATIARAAEDDRNSTLGLSSASLILTIVTVVLAALVVASNARHLKDSILVMKDTLGEQQFLSKVVIPALSTRL